MDGITTSINSILKNLIKNFNTLLDCPVRYAGEYNGQKIHNFIEYVESYKRIKCITDEQALRELQFLLIDKAHAWWLRRISHLTTWSEALTFLENHYSKERPHHIIYKEIFKHNYDDYNIKEDFIDDKIELLDELTQPKLSDKNKLELIYALLPNDIQIKLKFENMLNLKDLKEQLPKLKGTKAVVANLSEDQNTIVNVHNTEYNIFSETVSNEKANEHQQSYHQNINPASNGGDNNSNERDPIIKVRRTEDLMPHIKDEEEQNNHIQSTNNASLNRNDQFQIDSDIMNQINNIIDESEMNALHHNPHISTNISWPPDSNATIANLVHNNQSELSKQKLSESQRKSSQVTKKGKLRCSFCRRFNHTSQTCLKKAKQMKQFPERFMTPKTNKRSNDTEVSVNEVVVEPLMSNNNTDTASAATTELSIKTSSGLNTLISTLTPNSTVLAVSSFNNISEKSISSTLTTKLIAPINGPVPNKIMAAKLRNSNGHMPKCHQCGTVGFYKSICPNCSPIYNNNQYK